MTSVEPAAAAVSHAAELVRAGDQRALARLLTSLENGESEGAAILRLLGSVPSRAAVIGVTGYPGAGKSTLVDCLVSAYRKLGEKVGVLAVDISSPVTGGALLGDRIRMQHHASDTGVYIRSMATRGHHGGLAEAAADAATALKAAGYGVVLIETIGVGQDETEIAEVADTVVAVVAPGLGDEVQAMKAGLLEVADIVVVNKGDLPGSDAAVRDLKEWCPIVVRTVATNGEGVPELVEAIATHRRIKSLGRETGRGDGAP